MEIPIGLIIIAILVLVIALAYLVKIEIPRKASEIYVNELQAQSEMIRNVKPVVIGSFAILPTFNELGVFEWRREVVPMQSADAPQPVIDSAAHDDAVALIDATMTHANPKRKTGQLMTADECQQYGVLGGDRTRRQGAVDYLCGLYDVQSVSDKGNQNGVYYRGNNGDLSRLILDLAIKGKVPYSNQRPPAAA